MRSFKTGFTVGQARGLEIGNAAANEALDAAKANMAAMVAAKEEAEAAAAAAIEGGAAGLAAAGLTVAKDDVEDLHELNCDHEIIQTFQVSK